MTYRHIRYEVEDKIALVTISRPEVLNALNHRAQAELTDAWIRMRDDDDVIVGILTAEGTRAFSAGQDLKDRAEVDDGPGAEAHRSQGEMGLFPREALVGKPLIAALNGLALGMGAVLALQADIRVAAPNATIGYPLIKVGIFPPRMHEMWMLGPAGLALESLFTGDPLKAENAYRVGLINHLVSHEELLPKSFQIARKIRDNAPLVIRAIKETWDSEPLYNLVRSTRIYHLRSGQVSRSEDAMEGPRAFAQKRKPVWQGR
jgi:enoyl-CoA hydratase/carnithine racemase